MKLGFIGCGNMATAMIKGIIDSKIVEVKEICASAKSENTKNKIKKELKIKYIANNSEVVRFSDIIFLAVKPQYYDQILNEIKEAVTEEKILVSIAPGKSMDWIGSRLPDKTKIIRSMPNTPAMVKEGMMGMCKNEYVTDKEFGIVRDICDSFGETEIVTEQLMDVVVGVSGSSPAYVFMFIEAMADAAVAEGMPRKQAYKFAAQAMLGSAKMVLETGMHPGELKDMVCSPAGTTIEAVSILEEKGMRSAVIEASRACIKKGREI